MRHRPVLAAAAALALAGGTAGAALTAAGAAPAPAAAEPTVSVVAKRLAGPLSVAQAPDGTRYWTDSFAGPLYRQAPGGQPVVAFAGSERFPTEAVSADQGQLRFATSHNNEVAHVWTLDPGGNPVEVADTYAYEKRANPDRRFRYGFLRTPASCLDQLPEQVPGTYRGLRESHPYATAYAGGTTYVADAGANAVLAVSSTGAVSTVAALRPVRVEVTRSAAEANGLPACTVGRTFALEAVPTDVEVGPDGWLYVTSLPGGPEDGSLGLNGRVLRINPATGRVREVADGLLSPTGVAVAANGDVYVAELFRGRIAKIRAGGERVHTYVRLPAPAAVEVTPTGLLATANALPGKKPKGQVVTVTR